MLALPEAEEEEEEVQLALLTEHAGALLAVPPQKLYGRDLSLGLEHAPSTTSQHAYASEHSQPLPFALPATAASCCFLLDFFALGLALGLAAGVEGAAALEPAAVAGAPLPGTMGCTPCLHTHMTSPVSLPSTQPCSPSLVAVAIVERHLSPTQFFSHQRDHCSWLAA